VTPTVYNVATRDAERVPEEEIEARVLAGTHTFYPGTEIAAIDRRGRAVWIPAEQAADAFQQGYRLETDADVKAREVYEKYGKGFGNELRAFAEGAARAATFGASDVAFRALGVDAEGLAGRKEASPIAEGVGEAAGVIGSLLVPVPGATAAAAARAAGATKAIGFGAKAANEAKALAGALAPVQQVARLGKATESLAARGLEGIAARGGAARVAARAAEAFAGTAVEGAAYVSGMALSEQALGDPDVTASRVFSDVGLGAVLGGGLGIAGKGLSAGASKMKGLLEETFGAEALSRKAGEWGAKGLGITQGADKLARKGIDLSDIGNWAMNEKHAALGGKPIGGIVKSKKAAANARAVMEDAIERQSTYTRALDGKLGRPVMDLGDMYRPPSAGASGGVMWRVVDDLGDPALADIRAAVEAKLGAFHEAFKDGPVTFTRAVEHKRALDRFLRDAWGRQSNTPAMAEAKKIRHTLNEAVDSRIDSESRSVGMDAAGWMNAKKDYGWAAEVERLAGKKAFGEAKHRVISLSDHLWGLGIGGYTGGIPGALLGAVANKLAREYGPQVVSVAMNRVAKLDFLRSSAAAAQARMNEALRGVVAAKGAATKSGGVRPAFKRFDAKDWLAHPGAAKASAKSSMQAVLDVIDRYATSPEELASLLDKNLADIYEVAPGIGMAIAARTARALVYLHAAAPRPERPFNAFSSRGRPVSDMEQARFLDQVRAVSDPVTLVEDARDGTLTKAKVAAVAEAAPEDLAEIRMSVLDAAADHGDEMSFGTLAQLSILLDGPVTAAMAKDNISTWQQTFAQQAATDAQARQKAPAGFNGAGLAQGLESETQGLERRRAA